MGLLRHSSIGSPAENVRYQPVSREVVPVPDLDSRRIPIVVSESHQPLPNQDQNPLEYGRVTLSSSAQADPGAACAFLPLPPCPTLPSH